MSYENRLVFGATFPKGSAVANEGPEELIMLELKTCESFALAFGIAETWEQVTDLLGALVHSKVDLVGSRDSVWSAKTMLGLANDLREDPYAFPLNAFTRSCGLRDAIERLINKPETAGDITSMYDPSEIIYDKQDQVVDLNNVYRMYMTDHSERTFGEFMFDLGVRFTGE